MAVTTDSEKPADEKYIKILKLIVDDPTNYNKIMESAAYSGHIEIVKLMLEKGANNYVRAARLAARQDRVMIVKFLQEHQKNQKVECSKDAEINLLKKENESLKLKLNKIQEIII